MSRLKIIEIPNKLLTLKSNPVVIDKYIKNLLSQMVNTMYEADGIGLAGIQVGKRYNILTIDLLQDGSDPFFIINPKILNHSKEIISYEEGCLSVPNKKKKIPRFKNITIEYHDYDGIARKLEASDLMSVCIQHEMDHLEGITILDKKII